MEAKGGGIRFVRVFCCWCIALSKNSSPFSNKLKKKDNKVLEIHSILKREVWRE